MKKEIKIFFAKIIVACFFGGIMFFTLWIGYKYVSKYRVYPDMREHLSEYKSANICVIQKEETEDRCSYSSGASGIIFKKDNNGYYALTAYHVINADNSEFLIRTENDFSISEFRKNTDMGITSASAYYYDQFPIAEVLYKDEKDDLAILFFESDQDLESIPISTENPKKGDRIVTVGTNSEKMDYFVETYGAITQNETSIFHTNDGMLDSEVLKHNAFETYGFSGAGVLNEKMELVGINIGGGQNRLGVSVYGVMVPCEKINQFILESGLSVS